ncbi:MAG: hypothetical protein A3E80_02835 [Chlamydiae bacterium RIFCSPHIGHO2_12_FULL_49_9]|nr:MAG: hypothetical protein A3E80_02835 [Chlamydiae bacterium RIFCSPHIGHO2_12_FULL_49_9]
MKIFWLDKNGKSPPPDAKFYVRPFSSPLIAKKITRIDTLPPPASPIKILSKKFFPTKDEWIQNVEKTLLQIKKNHLKKVVLARTVTLEFETAPDPFRVTSALKQKSEGAFLFCLSDPSFSFLGATPERLFLREKSAIQSDALAGTKKRGEEGLLYSPKDLHEFSLVRTYIQETLSPFCSSITASPTSIHETANLQHLHSVVSACLEKPLSDLDILEKLHPTPALLGTPTEKASLWLQKIEPISRGFYGGAIGWIAKDSSDWIVAIRSCLLEKNTATLFSAAGIVEGSDPEKEWDELDQKLKLYDHIFYE